MSFLRCVYHRNRFLKSVYVELHVCQPVAVSSSSSASSSPSPPVVSFCTSTSSSSSSSGSNNHHHIVSSTQTSNSSNARDRLCVQIRPTSVANLISGHLPYLHFNRLTMSVCEASSKKASNQSSNNTRNNDNAGELQRSPVLQPNAFLSEGNYRWSRGGAAGGGGAGTSDQHRYQQSQQQQQNEQQHQQQTRCDFEWLSIRLLEKITFIGTAVAVGIDFRPRINEHISHRRGVGRTFNDYCHHQNHHHTLLGAAAGSNVDANNNNADLVATSSDVATAASPQLSAWRYPASSLGEQLGQYSCSDHNPSLTTIHFCEDFTCQPCHGLSESLFRVLLPNNNLGRLPASASMNNLSLMPNDELQQLRARRVAYRSGSETSGVETASGRSSISDELEETDRVRTTANSFEGPIVEVNEDAEEEAIVSPFGSFETGTPKIGEEMGKQLEDIIEKIELKTEIEDQKQTAAATVSFEGVPDCGERADLLVVEKEAAGESQEMANIFKQTSIEYADSLNNLMAIALMNYQRPHEAMDCWSNCEESAKAFFNMGVAYESGRYGRNCAPDLCRAHDCYALASSMGHAKATYNLALFYLYGKGEIEKHEKHGLMLLKLAASGGVEVAKDYLEQLKALEEDEKQKAFKQEEEELETGTMGLSLSEANRRARYQARPTSVSMVGPAPAISSKQYRRLYPNHWLEQGVSIIGSKNPNNNSSSSSSLKRHNSAPDLLMLAGVGDGQHSSFAAGVNMLAGV